MDRQEMILSPQNALSNLPNDRADTGCQNTELCSSAKTYSAVGEKYPHTGGRVVDTKLKLQKKDKSVIATSVFVSSKYKSTKYGTHLTERDQGTKSRSNKYQKSKVGGSEQKDIAFDEKLKKGAERKTLNPKKTSQLSIGVDICSEGSGGYANPAERGGEQKPGTKSVQLSTGAAEFHPHDPEVVTRGRKKHTACEEVQEKDQMLNQHEHLATKKYEDRKPPKGICVNPPHGFVSSRNDRGTNGRRQEMVSSHSELNKCSTIRPLSSGEKKRVHKKEMRQKETRKSDRNMGQQVLNVEKHLEDIVGRADREIKKHELKIADARNKLDGINSTLSKQVSVDLFNRLYDERNALNDRVKELGLQKDEFQAYLRSLQSRLKELVKESFPEKDLLELRKCFDVECCRLRKALPMYSRRQQIVELVKNNQVSIILGETGSGKSTQLTQYLYQTGFAQKGQIACTQPRKIAAISLATHVASEMATSVGHLVGYQVGMKTKRTSDTKIVYLTDHVLLNEYLKDNLLSAYSCLIIDEAHERTIFTDLLLGMIKSCLAKRQDLKLIVTSATIDPKIFENYFDGCPVFKVSGRAFPVEVIWQTDSRSESFENYEQNAVDKAVEVHTCHPEGDILVFMTSVIETEKACKKVQQRLVNRQDFQCMQLHGRLQTEEQQLVFEPLQKGQRKIVFATNSAETSVTIPNIKYVIDTGVVKEVRFDAKRNINSLDVTTITKSSAEQRKGRAGRTAPGTCYRLYSEEDYNKLASNSTPEILRVNLSQALLQLYELGVDPISFNFVESPNTESLRTAIDNLCCLGAVKDGSITDLGKWLSKLPVAPLMGHMIWQGIQSKVTMEAIVVASGCSTGVSVFYRGNKDTDKKKSELNKTKFAHKGGDLMTLLNVYREWKALPEKAKNKWCVDNSVNAKSIRGVRDTVNEIIHILKNDIKQKTNYNWLEAAAADDAVHRVICRCYIHNLCHFMGYAKAGYLALESYQHLLVHPSSVMVSLAYNAEWIVFEQIRKTSDNFAVTLTPVPEEFLKEAIENGDLELDIECARKLKLSPIFSEVLGQTVFRDFVGPCFSRVKALDTQINDACRDDLTILEANKEMGTVEIFCMNNTNAIPSILVSEAIDKSKAKIDKWDVERQVSKLSDVRVVLGSGGQVKHVFMSEDFRSVFVKCHEKHIENLTTDDIEDVFKHFGEIIDCVQFTKRKDRTTWGRLRFKMPESAKQAVTNSHSDQRIWAYADRQIAHKVDPFPFKAKLSLCRRKPKGFCFVLLKNPKNITKVLRFRKINIAEESYTMKLNKRDGNQLFIPKLPDYVTREDVEEAFNDLLGDDSSEEEDEDDMNIEFGSHTNSLEDEQGATCKLPGDKTINRENQRLDNQTLESDQNTRTAVLRVDIPREHIDIGKENIEKTKQMLMNAIQNLIPCDNFSVTLRDPKPKDFVYTGLIAFKDAAERSNVCESIDCRRFGDNDAILHVDEDIITYVVVLGFIYKAVKTEIDNLHKVWKTKDPETKLNEKVLRNGNVAINIHTNTSSAVVRYQTEIHEIIDGDTFDAGNRPNFHVLFMRDANKQLKVFENKTGALIHVDNRNMCVRVYGSQQSRREANDCINKYLEHQEKLTSIEINLKTKAGLLKALVCKFGYEFADFKNETEITSADVDYRRHSLKITGTKESLDRAIEVVQQLPVICLDSVRSNNNVLECVICFCPIETYDLYRLEGCGHPYCQECARRQFRAAVTHRSFPVLCCFENCGAEWLWCDISYFIRLGVSTLQEVTETSISAFVKENKDAYSYCITPDCPSIFRRSRDRAVFQCKECCVRICTKCCIQYHDSMTCAMYNCMKNDPSLRDWYKQDPKNRKICPNCSTGIEKIDGCNNMLCAVCKGHICWVCLEYFKTNQECYGHLQKKHDGFM